MQKLLIKVIHQITLTVAVEMKVVEEEIMLVVETPIMKVVDLNNSISNNIIKIIHIVDIVKTTMLSK